MVFGREEQILADRPRAKNRKLKTMKTTQPLLISATALVLLAAPWQSSGIVGIGIERECTNIVMSWPSQGHEYYLIQYDSVSPDT